ncbi:MAG: ABC transporter substrate-binding protein [Rhodococcus sp.]|uniref:glycine betaine ABC transporter substrate-binding protein n=1 Tax=Rhodococcus TaxID=1827 RepID=UPI00169A334E|nr:glycine betaine ABC transporter substrate-binding protein [Rhodococcus sp. (in: high G+C Gram-positive bacteria)]NLV78424.1 ABC transporter substrate-binding protein [Rhodococcus sp. (in: high G+C Gram-positive bacteria)]
MAAVNGTWKSNRPRTVPLLVAAALASALAGCASPVLDPAATPGPVVVAAPDGPVGDLLAEIYSGALRDAGIDATVSALPDATAALAALDAGEVTLVPGYTGRLLHRFVPDAVETDAEDVFDALARAVPGDATIADHAAAQDRALLLTAASETAVGDTGQVAALPDVLDRCGEFTLVYTPGFEAAGGLAALDRAGCIPRERASSAGTEAVAAASTGGVLAGLTTTDPALSRQTPPGVAALHDAPDRTDGDEVDEAPTPVFPAQNVVPVFRKESVTDTGLDALRVVAGELTTADLATMLERIGGGEDAAVVAGDWLSEHG